MLLVIFSPLTLPQGPAGYDPQGHHEHQQHRAGADSHQGFQHEPRVKVYSIECTNTTRASVREKFTMKQHHSTNEVEPQEHGQAQGHVHGHPLGPYLPPVVGQLGGPEEVEPAGDGVDGTDEELHAYLHHPLPRHGYPPVISTIIDHEQLKDLF